MAHVLVFGGTTEGRSLVSWLADAGVRVTACSATEYGGSLLVDDPLVTSHVARLNQHQMVDLMRSSGVDLVVDATHPYATCVTESVRAAAGECGLPLVRVLREGVPEGPWTSVPSTQAAADLLAQRSGNVLLTTGSKDLPAYVAAVPDFAERLYARILPVASSLEQASQLGIPVSRIIAMQGPFSAELNRALIRSLDIAVMVTKASGARGGFDEKVQAAQETGCELVVIDRPVEEEGCTLEQAKQVIAQLLEQEGA